MYTLLIYIYFLLNSESRIGVDVVSVSFVISPKDESKTLASLAANFMSEEEGNNAITTRIAHGKNKIGLKGAVSIDDKDSTAKIISQALSFDETTSIDSVVNIEYEMTVSLGAAFLIPIPYTVQGNAFDILKVEKEESKETLWSMSMESLTVHGEGKLIPNAAPPVCGTIPS